jgi:hypothetical protein
MTGKAERLSGKITSRTIRLVFSERVEPSGQSMYVATLIKLFSLITHTAIQARLDGEEYALVQTGREGYSDDEVESTLRSEYELLLHGHFYKKEFDDHAEKCSVTMPSVFLSRFMFPTLNKAVTSRILF